MRESAPAYVVVVIRFTEKFVILFAFFCGRNMKENSKREQREREEQTWEECIIFRLVRLYCRRKF